MNNEISIKAYQDGVEIRFPFTTLPQHLFDCLTQCIKRNRDSGKIHVYDLNVLKDDVAILRVGGLQNHVSEFVQLLECELLMSIPCETTAESLHNKILGELNKLIDEP